MAATSILGTSAVDTVRFRRTAVSFSLVFSFSAFSLGFSAVFSAFSLGSFTSLMEGGGAFFSLAAPSAVDGLLDARRSRILENVP